MNHDKIDTAERTDDAQRTYEQPTVTDHGSLAHLTLSSTAAGSDGSSFGSAS